jgi:hypothetical protein
MTPAVFAHQMFLTPPYPSTMEWMLFGAVSCIREGLPVTSCSGVENDLSYTDGILAVTDRFPNIQILPQIGLYDLSSAHLALALTYFQYYADNFKGHQSVYGVGVESEYTENITLSAMTDLKAIASGDGLQFISYGQSISTDELPSGAYLLGHSNYPVGDGQWVLFWFENEGQDVGISTGYDSYTAFPETRPIPSFFTSMDSISPPIGWSQAVIHVILNDTILGKPDEGSAYDAPPASLRQYVDLCVGEDGTWGGGIGSAVWFTDTAGVSTYMLWDNATLRNWIWTDPDYQSNFVLSTSPVATTTTSSTTTSDSSLDTGLTLPTSLQVPTLQVTPSPAGLRSLRVSPAEIKLVD